MVDSHLAGDSLVPVVGGIRQDLVDTAVVAAAGIAVAADTVVAACPLQLDPVVA